MSGSGKSDQEVFWTFHVSTARKCTRKCAVIYRPIVVFHSSGQRDPTTVFCKISVRRSKFCLEFSFTWLKISR